MNKPYAALYGNVCIQKEWCDDCEAYAFVKKKVLQCCDRSSKLTAEMFKREVSPENRRRPITPTQKREQLAKQGNRCLYCGTEFYPGVPIHWDHFVPFNYSQDNSCKNYVAACQPCNSIKHTRFFTTVEEAREYILPRLQARLLR